MAKLAYNEIKEKSIIVYNGEPCEVVESHVARTQQRKPQNQTKLKSMISKKTFAATFHTSDTADEADVEKQTVTFLYTNRGEYWFCEAGNPKNRFQIAEDTLGDKKQYLKENEDFEVIVFIDDNENEQVIDIILPIKMTFTVKEAPPNVKGNTASGADKKVVLETGAVVTAPMFIETGDQIIVNTETGEYAERAK